MSRYSTISVPVELHDELRKMVKEKPRLGYTSVAEFCKEAIRLHAAQIRIERKEAALQQLNLDDLAKKIDLLSSTTGGVYRHIFEGLNDAVFYIAVDGRIINCNDQMVSQLGYAKKEELLNGDISLVFANEREMNSLMEEVKRKSFIKDYEVNLKRKDDKIINFLLSMGKVKKNDRTIGYHGVGKDITVRKIAEERLKKARDTYSYIINELYDSIVVVQDGKIKFAGREPLLSGYNEVEALGKNFLDFITPEDKKRVEEMYKRLMEGKKIPSIVKTKVISKEGKVINVEASVKKIEYEGGPAALISLRDISKRES